jgi:hypothetical protein
MLCSILYPLRGQPAFAALATLGLSVPTFATSASRPPAIRDPQSTIRVSFVNDVVPVLTKAGCNAGACHGSQYGKGGFKLSLLGYDPDSDHLSIRSEARARRVTPAAPERSLLLRKASGAVPHGGGVRLPIGSPGYGVLLTWLRDGGPAPAARERRLAAIALTPGETTIIRTGAGVAAGIRQLRVVARYSDGTTRDVTRWSRFVSNHDNVAQVDGDGRVTVTGNGEAVIRAHHGSQVAVCRILAPLTPRGTSPAGARFPRPTSLVDPPIFAKLRRLGITPSPLCSDAVFLRRVSLDLTGTLPGAQEARRFLASRDPNKRRKLIEALLERPEYVDTWTYRLGDLLRSSRRSLGTKGMTAFHGFLRDAVARNRRWDEVVREMVTARGSLWDVGPANYYGVGGSPEDWAENTSQALLGVRLQCARCHNHPFDRWTREDYHRFAAFFGRLKTKDGGERGDKTVFVADEGEVKHPKTGAVMAPMPLAESRPPVIPDDGDRREALARWLTAPENPWFARALVNRLWGHLMGRGLIDPVDDLRATNPPSNDAALQALTSDFIANDFSLKHTLRVICSSATYQLASEVNPTNRFDETQFSHHLVRRLGAEQILDAVVQVTGVPEKFPGVPLGARAVQLPDTAVPSYFLDLFGRPARAVACECEREMAPNLAQTLHIMNGDSVNAKIRAPEGRLAKLLETEKTDEQVLEELFLSTLTRLPTARERRSALTEIRNAASRKEAFSDLLWALLNSREFLFSH